MDQKVGGGGGGRGGHFIPLVGLTILNPIMYQLRLKLRGVFKTLSSNKMVIYLLLVYFNIPQFQKNQSGQSKNFTTF